MRPAMRAAIAAGEAAALHTVECGPRRLARQMLVSRSVASGFRPAAASRATSPRARGRDHRRRPAPPDLRRGQSVAGHPPALRRAAGNRFKMERLLPDDRALAALLAVDPRRDRLRSASIAMFSQDVESAAQSAAADCAVRDRSRAVGRGESFAAERASSTSRLEHWWSSKRLDPDRRSRWLRLAVSPAYRTPLCGRRVPKTHRRRPASPTAAPSRTRPSPPSRPTPGRRWRWRPTTGKPIRTRF